MSFERVIDAAIELLRRRQRITYRALQREFALDDGALADLADELIRGQRLAYDEDGAVLVWSGTPAKAAERRRLTVMFCDLVGSTQLSRRLDPEDLHALLRRYQDDCATALRPFGGHIAQYLGDGILAYFGYPVAHEDDAERAVRAGLAVVQAARALSAEINQRFGVGLAVRVGLHTGLVVLGDIGPAERRETLALGEAPNLAAHIQAQAEPDSVLVSEATYALLRDRSAKAKSRFSKERDDERALKERQNCLIALKRDLDVPAEVLAALPSPEEILAKAEAARARARAVNPNLKV